MADSIDFTGKMLVRNSPDNTYALYKDRYGKYYAYYNHKGVVDDIFDTNTRVVGDGKKIDLERQAIAKCLEHKAGELWDVVYKRGEKSLVSSRGSYEVFADGVDADGEEDGPALEVWNIYKWEHDDFMMKHSRRFFDSWNDVWSEKKIGLKTSKGLAILYKSNESTAVEIAEVIKKNYR